ncbi:SnoaL-like domain-containing protein [Rhodococcoides fascians A21d2]|uniref:nuclear transport factor 2 family protein n=1 Tax=Rhodococcoides fascians TaxID=1828 RepID=UPI00055FCFFD|nr:nuclear transport factor 2 family protein [Rhodococcus fascians]QII00235.1 SnoaL-like domain-containing protein [Rhodococcus fascians A21d2]
MSEIRTDELVDTSDFIELTRLAQEVAWRVDNHQAVTLPDLFTDDGSIATLGEASVGHDAIRSWGRMMDTNSPIPGVRHVLTNLRFTTNRRDTATGLMYVTAYLDGAPTGQGTLPFAMGLGTDHYRRSCHGWKVASRNFEPYFLRK